MLYTIVYYYVMFMIAIACLGFIVAIFKGIGDGIARIPEDVRRARQQRARLPRRYVYGWRCLWAYIAVQTALSIAIAYSGLWPADFPSAGFHGSDVWLLTFLVAPIVGPIAGALCARHARVRHTLAR